MWGCIDGWMRGGDDRLRWLGGAPLARRPEGTSEARGSTRLWLARDATVCGYGRADVMASFMAMRAAERAPGGAQRERARWHGRKRGPGDAVPDGGAGVIILPAMAGTRPPRPRARPRREWAPGSRGARAVGGVREEARGLRLPPAPRPPRETGRPRAPRPRGLPLRMVGSARGTGGWVDCPPGVGASAKMGTAGTSIECGMARRQSARQMRRTLGRQPRPPADRIRRLWAEKIR